MKLLVVTAYYSGWEWNREDLVGVYDSEERAEEAKKAYQIDIDLRKLEESPLTEEEQLLDTLDLPDDRYQVNWDWLQRLDDLRYFGGVEIKEIILNNEPIML